MKDFMFVINRWDRPDLLYLLIESMNQTLKSMINMTKETVLTGGYDILRLFHQMRYLIQSYLMNY